MPISHELDMRITQAWATQDYTAGRALLAQAAQHDPGNPQWRAAQVAALGYGSLFTSAQAAQGVFLDSCPPDKRPRMAALLGVEWCRIGRHDFAEVLLRQAWAAGVHDAPLYEALTDALEHLRRPAEALAMAEDGLARHPGHPGINLVVARLLSQGGDPAAENALRALAGDAAAPPAIRGEAWRELGQLLESFGQVAAAFHAYEQSKHVLRPLHADFLPVARRRIELWRDAQRQLPSAANFRSWAAEARSMEEQFSSHAFLVGCPRSGTTLLERVLSAHAGVACASETAILNSEVWLPLVKSRNAAIGPCDLSPPCTQGQAERLRADYWRHIPDALEREVAGRLLLDKNTTALGIVPTIVRVFSTAKLIMSVRHPLDIAWSCFTHAFPLNADAAGFMDLGDTCARVGAQLENWLVLRERLATPWHEVRYESVVADFDAEIGRTTAFLSLPQQEGLQNYHLNQTLVRSPSYAQASRPIYGNSVARWRAFEAQLGPHMKILENVIKKFGY